VAGAAGLLVLAGCGGSGSTGRLAASSGTVKAVAAQADPDVAAAQIEAEVTAAMGAGNGCWDPTFDESNFDGAYQQLFYNLGEQPATKADLAVGATGCVSTGAPGVPDDSGVLDLQWFHSPVEAETAASDGGEIPNLLAVYRTGSLLLAESTTASPALEAVVAKLPGLKKA
jgi:hypothetical protein